MATETLLSPGVLLQETDKSFITPGVDPSGMAIIGPTAKGPVNTPTRVTNYQEFKDIFGTTIRNGSYREELYTNLSVKNYFANGGSSVLVVRAVSGSFSTASNTPIAATDDGDAPFTLVTLGEGEALNNSANAATAPEQFANSTAFESGSIDNLKWEINNVNNSNGTFTLVIRRGDDTNKQPIVLESFPEISLDPNHPNYIAKAIGDQYQTAAVDGETGDYLMTNFGEFSNRSKFIRVATVDRPTIRYRDASGEIRKEGALSGSLPATNQSGGFGGANGDILSATAANNKFGQYAGTTVDNIQGLHTGSYDIPISLLKNKDEFSFKTLIAPGLNISASKTTLDTIIENTTLRGDSFFVLDSVPYGTSVDNATEQSNLLDTSFAATYWPWVQVFSSELARNVWCPASTIIPGIYSKNDSIGAPWFAPAGETRGKVGRLVTGVEKKLSKANRDTLYSNKINPIASFTDSGLLVFGQKTLQNAASALDRVNVRRMLLDVKDTIGGFADEILFDQNTETVRNAFIVKANKYLDNLVQRNGLYAYQVKMDGQLNTADVIDQNMLVGQVFLQPTKTAEFIVIDFTLTRTGATFTD